LVRGELVDGATGQGLADVPVRIADAAVLTDKNGSFVVPRLPTGDYPLTVDAQALPRGHIVAQGLPYTVSVRGGKVAVVRLSTREAASISGEVLREVGDTIERETEREEEAKERVPMEGVVVEITGTTQEGRDVYQRRLTDSNGAFRLLGLVAGRYQARVLPGSLPELHTATPATQTIELRDGAAEDVTFVVRPVKRKIQFLKVGGSH
jgi:RNase P/RNase MRP subunit p29